MTVPYLPERVINFNFEIIYERLKNNTEIFNTSPHPPSFGGKKTPVFGSEISHPIQVLTGKILDPDLTSLSVTKQKRKIRVYFPAIHNYKLKKIIHARGL